MSDLHIDRVAWGPHGFAVFDGPTMLVDCLTPGEAMMVLRGDNAPPPKVAGHSIIHSDPGYGSRTRKEMRRSQAQRFEKGPPLKWMD